MQSNLDKFRGNDEATQTARQVVRQLSLKLSPRAVISGPRLGKTLLFSMIEADSGIESRVRKLWATTGTGRNEIEAVFAEARQIEGGVVCLENAEFINTRDAIVALLGQLDEPTNSGISVFFVTSTPLAELDVALHRRLQTQIELVRISS